MLTVVELAVTPNVAPVDGRPYESQDVGLRPGATLAGIGPIGSRCETALVEDSGVGQSGALLAVEREDLAYEDVFIVVYDKSLFLDRVAEGDGAARPHSLPPCGRNL